MEIDFFTVGAQIFNFLVLVALLKRFLWGPVTRAMDEREQRIASTLAEADSARRAGEEEAQRLRQQNADLEADRERLAAEVRQEADAERRRLLDEAREDVARQRERWREALRDERESLLEELQRQLVERVYAVARRALGSLADEDLEQVIARAFLKRLEELDPELWERIRPRSHDGVAATLHVTSAFPLPDDLRAEVEREVRARAGPEAIVDFEVRGEPIAGIELRAPGLRVGWSLGDFIGSLEEVFPGEEDLAARPGGAAR